MRNSFDRRTLFIQLLVRASLLCLLAATVQAQSGNGSQQITQSVIAGGGGSSSNGSTQVDGTAGQSATGTSTGGSYTLESGFWEGAALTPSSLVVSDATGTYGGTVTLTATLTANSVNLSGKDVTFSLNGTSVGTANTDSNGVATLNNVSLAGINAGTYPAAISAQFAGDATFTAASATSQLTVQKATPLLQVAGGTFAYDGQPHPATAMATGVNNEVLTPVSLLYNGGSAVPVNAGTYMVTASFAGDQNYNAVSNSSQSIVITQASQSISFGALPNRAYGDGDFTVSATASSGLSVSFTATDQCTVTGTTVHLTGAGSCTVTAAQAGNGNYSAATPVSQSFSIGKATATITLANLSQTYDGTPKLATATTNPSGLTVNLTYSQGGNAVASPINAGSYDVSATINDQNYQGSASATLVIGKATPMITWSNPADLTYGTALSGAQLSATANVPGSFAYTPAAGTILNAGANQTLSVIFTPTDTANYNTASKSVLINVLKANQTISFGALADKAYGDADFSVSATASSGLGVSFTATGQCTVTGTTVHLTGAGSCSITAAQSGDNNYTAATSVTQSFNIALAATTTTVTSSANPSTVGQTVTFTATVAASAGTPTGTVQFKDNGTNLGSPVALNASGVATLTTSALAAGTHVITAAYSGDASFNISTGTLNNGQTISTQPVLSINDVTQAEGNSGTTAFTFTVTLSVASSQTVTVNYATADGTATVAGSDYGAASGMLSFAPGETSKTITVLVNGDTTGEADETFTVGLSAATDATLGKAIGTGTILNDDAPGIQFSAPTYTVNEDGVDAIITVTRSGDNSQTASVDYASLDQAGLTPCGVANGLASQRCDYEMVLGTLHFAAGVGTQAISIPIIDDAYVEGPETFTISLSNARGAALAVNATATITIVDNDSATAPNPIDQPNFFIRQQYLDFLGREPEPAGMQGWLNILNNCPQGNTACDRIEVSSDFFRSEEYQMRRYYIYRFYETLGRKPQYAEFTRDVAKVDGFLSEMSLEAMKAAFVQDFMSRSEFKQRYDATLNDPTAYVELLLQAVGLPTHPSRQTWIANLTNGTQTRDQVLRELVESAEVYNKFYNEAFVVQSYFGYLRREPDSLYLQWIQTMNQTGGYRTLVNGFMNSPEYKQRFGQ